MRLVVSTLLLCLLICISSCAVLTGSRDIALAESFVKQKQYHSAVTTYREILRESPNSFYAADARYGLALALMASDNPQKDYAQALHECEEFSKLYPNERRIAEIQNLIGILKTVTSLNRSIEELKKLDIRHEERRRK